MKKYFWILLIGLFTIMACSEKGIVRVSLSDENDDQVYHIGPSSELLGNVDLFIMTTMQGATIFIVNGPASIGYDIRLASNSSFIYFADSYISAGGSSIQTGTQSPYNKWVKIHLVVYRSGLSGWAVIFLKNLGLDFFKSIQKYATDKAYEIEVKIVGNKLFNQLKINSEEDKTIIFKRMKFKEFKKMEEYKTYLGELEKIQKSNF